MRRRQPVKTLIALLVMLSVVITTGTFAYWATEVEGTVQTVSDTLSIGSGKNVKTTISLKPVSESQFGFLVPIGHSDNSNGLVTEHVAFVYQLLWQEKQLVSQIDGEEIYGDISVDIDYDIIIAGSEKPLDKLIYKNVYDLVNIVPSKNNTNSLMLNDANISEFGFTTSLNEPRNKSEYALITNTTINFSFTFTIDTDIYDLDLNFIDMDKNELLSLGAVSPNISDWLLEEKMPLVGASNYNEKYIFFPITKDDYTITVEAQLSDILSTTGGYGIIFDTYFDDEGFEKDNGYILQFDRGYSYGEMIIRPRVGGYERNPFWREMSRDSNYFPTKYEDPQWWIDIHELRIEVSTADDFSRTADIYLDDQLLGTATYDKQITEDQLYVGFRTWGKSPTDFYSLTVE